MPRTTSSLRQRRGRLGIGALVLLAGVAGLAAQGSASSGATKLQETTDKWRSSRARDFPVEHYLRPLVAADSAFNRDSTSTPESLSPAARNVWDGLHLLLSTELQAQYLGLSSDSLRAEWVRRYWRLRDPTPTTPENERLDVHQRRLEDARSKFAMKNPPGWDDRGIIWIQFGEPDSVIEEGATVEDGIGFTPGHQEWLYVSERWVVEFERPNPKGPWKLGRSSAKLSYRPDLVARDRKRLGFDPRYEPPTPSSYDRASDIIGFAEDRLLSDPNDMLNEQLDSDVVRHEVRTNARARDLMRKKTESTQRFRKQYEAGGERFVVAGKERGNLWYVFDVDVFKGPPGRMRVEVHYQLNLQDLKFAWRDSTYVAGYRAEGVLLDARAQEAGRDEYHEVVKAADFSSTMAAKLIPGQLMFDVPEGSYRLGIRLVDAMSGNEGTCVTAIDVPRLDGRRFALSDVQLATSIVYAGDDWRSRFVKKDRLVVPNPIRAYKRDSGLVGYFEIYGLKLDANRVCHYEVQYTIAPRTLTAQAKTAAATPGADPGEAFVSSKFEDEGGSSELVQELRIDVGSLASDTYDLVLTVRDLTAGVEATSRSSFTLLE